jgi:hypothetical protein
VAQLWPPLEFDLDGSFGNELLAGRFQRSGDRPLLLLLVPGAGDRVAEPVVREEVGEMQDLVQLDVA